MNGAFNPEQKNKKIDNYILESKLGEGQFGEVYKGRNLQNDDQVAVKTVKREILKDAKFYELLENEIKVLKACDNENIVKLYDIKKTSNNIYLVLEYCNEGDLSDLQKSHGGRLSEKLAIEYLQQMFNAFKTLFDHKIMHRDFKPSNVLIHDGKIKIADFGFSKLLGNKSHTRTILGSPLNMAPEVMEGKPYGAKADVWSVGVTFYELLFGDHPWKAKTLSELLENIKGTPLVFPDNVKIGDTTKDILKRMMVVDAGSRASWTECFEHDIANLKI